MMSWLGVRFRSNLDKVPDYATMRDLSLLPDHDRIMQMMDRQVGNCVVLSFRKISTGSIICDVHISASRTPKEQIEFAWDYFKKRYPNGDPSRVMLTHD